MRLAETELASLHIPRLAVVATSASPAWLWAADGSHLLWANAVGAAIFGAADGRAAGTLRFGAGSAPAAQIPRLAATLPSGGQERLERLRGFGAALGAPLMCACARIVLPDGVAAILVAALEPAGPSLALAERAQRLFRDADAVAVFAPDGALLHAGAAAQQRLKDAKSLAALGVEGLAATALEAGRARGLARLGATDAEVTLLRLGNNDSRVLALAFPASEARAEPPPAAALATATKPSAVGTSEPAEPASATRRHPLRFVWQMDAEGRFAVGSDEFIELVGRHTIAACGRLWSEIAAELKLDPDHEVARAIATQETWSGIEVSWPVDETGERLTVEMSGLPVFDRDRKFGGYRGFGVCRDVGRINDLLRTRRSAPIGFAAAPPPPPPQIADTTAAAAALPGADPAPVTAAAQAVAEAAPVAAVEQSPAEIASPAANVVPFRVAAPPEAKPPTLSPVERNAFRELAQELTARLRGSPHEPAEAADRAPTERPDEPVAAQVAGAIPEPAPAPIADSSDAAVPPPRQPPSAERVLLDRIPAGVLVYRNGALLYANRHFLELSGYDTLDALAAAGGLNALFAESGAGALNENGAAQKLSLLSPRGEKRPVDGRLLALPWDGTSALALVLTGAETEERRRAGEAALEAAQNEIRDLKSNLERTARREAQKAAAAKAEFLAKVSHEIRTPLNSMIGFAEVIMAERFGSIGNERYREYLKDIHEAGTHLVSVLNDLLDLSKIETGQLDLKFANVDLNDVTQQCVAIMQPQANRGRIIIRSALTPGLSPVVADARSVRQIVINLLSHAIKLTGPGGQVIVSTAVADGGEAVLRVRDTGLGMREADIEAVLDPFHHTATGTNWGSGGNGLGLPLTKALAEANRANFSIKSAPNSGTLVEIAFPLSRMAAR